MKHYQLTSESFSGAIDLFYNDLELLEKYDISNATLSEQQQVWILKYLPRELAEMTKLTASTPTLKLTEVKDDITFEMFWKRYDDKVASSRKRTLKLWNRMPAAERQKAYNYINRYMQSLPPGTRKKYAETYLNAELWNN
jgi:hypothetical protein